MKTLSDDDWIQQLLQFFLYDTVGDVTVGASEGDVEAVAKHIVSGKLKQLKKFAKWIKGNKGKKLPGTKKGGGNFKNDGRDGSQKLPSKDSNGNSITYKEYDIKPSPQHGANRGAERLVVGSDGRAWYTKNHYKSFTQVKH